MPRKLAIKTIEKAKQPTVYNLDKWLGSSKFGALPDFDIEDYLKTPASYSWIYACVNVIAQYIASMPIKFYKWKNNIEKEEVIDSPFYRLFDNPNADYTRWEFLYTLASQLVVSGNAYIYKFPLKNPIELHILYSRLVKLKPDSTGQRRVSGYIYGDPSNQINFEPDEIIHIKLPSAISYLYGTSPIQAGKEDITSDVYAREYNKNFFKNGTMMGGYVTQEPNDQVAELSLSNQDTLQQQLNLMSGSSKAHKWYVLPANCKVVPLSGSIHQDIQFLELRRFTRQTVLSLFGVPPTIINLIEENTSYSNIKEQHVILWENTLKPKMELIAQAITKYLVAPLFPDQFCQFDLSSVTALKEDETQKYTRTIQAVQNGLMTINEARQLLDLDPRTESEADSLLLPYSLAPIGSYSEPAPQDNATAQKMMVTKSAEDRRRTWLRAHSKNRQYELMIKTACVRQFRKDKELFLNKLNDKLSNKSISDLLAIQKAITITPETKQNAQKYIVKAINVEEDLNEFYERWKNGVVKGLLVGIYEESFKNVAGNANINAQSLAMYTKDRENKIIDVVDETFKQVMDIVNTGIVNGDGVEVISENVSKQFDEMEKYRSDRIARTETGTAVNKGQFDGAKETGITTKTWVSVSDDATRDNHADMDGESVGIYEKFSNGLDHPCDPAGASDEVINCRCVVEFSV